MASAGGSADIPLMNAGKFFRATLRGDGITVGNLGSPLVTVPREREPTLGRVLECMVKYGGGVIWCAGRSEVRLAKDVVQVLNPRTDRYVKIDRDAGRIISQKKSPGPYKNIPVARKRKDK